MAGTRRILVTAALTAGSLLASAGSEVAFLSGPRPAYGAVGGLPGNPDRDPAAAEQRFVQLINAERAAAGLGPLTPDAQLSNVARDHAGTMASQGTIFHNLNLGKVVTGAWKLLGENVGVGGTVQSLHDAFMASVHHRKNVLGTYDRVGLGVVLSGSMIYVTEVFWLSKNPGAQAGTPAPDPAKPPVTGTAAKPTGNGYWLARADGEVQTVGDAPALGSLAGKPLVRPIVGTAATPTGNGYWLVASDGGIFAFGDARFHGSTGAIRLNQPIVGMAATPSGNGYWLVASDGGIFAFGDARFHGSTGAIRLNRPIVGMASSLSGAGYWLVASDGGIFNFGDAGFHGSGGGTALAKPIVGMTRTPTGKGYYLVAGDGRVLSHGDALA